MFSQVWLKIKEMIAKMIGKTTIEQTMHVSPAISSEMIDAIECWEDMYKGKAPWVHEPTFADPSRVVSLGLPAFIASEKARMATLEMKSEITKPQKQKRAVEQDTKKMMSSDHLDSAVKDESVEEVESPRVKLLNDTYQEKVLRRLRQNLEYGIALGGMVIKPFVVLLDDKKGKADATATDANNDKQSVKARIDVDFVPADHFFQLSFTVNGQITEAAFVQTKVDKNHVYRRLEHHKLVGNKVIIKNRAFLSFNNSMTQEKSIDAELGKEISLKEVPEWKDFAKEVTIENVDRLLFGYFKMPEANTIDPKSPLGISGFARALHLIHDADIQYSNLLWEFEATQAAIDIDRDALKPYEDKNGVTHSVNLMLQERLFRRLDLGSDDTYNPFIPPIRDESIINGLNAILTRIEDVCSLSRGAISTYNVKGATTASEQKMLKQRSYCANADIQKELEHTLKDVIYVMNTYCDLYNLVPESDYEVSFEWDDSILVDTAEEMTKRMQLVQYGISSKIEMRMWYFGETEEQARLALKQIDEENKKSILENAKLQQEAGMTLQTLNNNQSEQQKVNGRKDDASQKQNQVNKINNDANKQK